MSGVVDPETLYTKQNCIGMLLEVSLGSQHNAHSNIGGGSFGKVYKG